MNHREDKDQKRNPNNPRGFSGGEALLFLEAVIGVPMGIKGQKR